MSVANLLISARRAFSERRARERAYAGLMSLDDHALADIGVHRSQIAVLVEGVRGPGLLSPPIPLPARKRYAQRKEA